MPFNVSHWPPNSGVLIFWKFSSPVYQNFLLCLQFTVLWYSTLSSESFFLSFSSASATVYFFLFYLKKLNNRNNWPMELILNSGKPRVLPPKPLDPITPYRFCQDIIGVWQHYRKQLSQINKTQFYMKDKKVIVQHLPLYPPTPRPRPRPLRGRKSSSSLAAFAWKFFHLNAIYKFSVKKGREIQKKPV